MLKNLLFIFAITCASSVFAQASFSELIVFGDSLSDTGNVAGAITPNLPAPYFDNRISNGPLAIDVLAANLGKNAAAVAAGGHNYAVVGGNIMGDGLGDLTAQVNRYFSNTGGQSDASALYVVIMGGNDLRDLRAQTSPVVVDQSLDQIIAVLASQLQQLLNRGARSIVVANVADIGRIPQTLDLELSDPGISARTTAYVQSFNTKLSQLLANLGAQDASMIIKFDAFSELNEILDSPATFGFNITRRGCFDPNDSINPFDFSFDASCANPSFPFGQPDFSEYVFFDSIHPTSAAHGLIGQALIDRLVEQNNRRILTFLPAITQLLLAN